MKIKVDISLVIPIYNEEKNLRILYLSLVGVLSELKKSYEIIFIDDGSTDKSFDILKNFQRGDREVKIIKFGRNCGQPAAYLTGFEKARGKIVVTMDADLQYSPESIPGLIAKIQEGFDFVNGWRVKRKESLLRKLFGFLFTWFVGMKTGVKLHDYGCSLCALTNSLAKQLKYYPQFQKFLKPLAVQLANSVAEVKVLHYPRKFGRSRYNFLKLIKMAIDFVRIQKYRPQKA